MLDEKSSLNYTKVVQKEPQHFYLKSNKIAQKVANILTTFARQFVTKNFLKLPNLVTLSPWCALSNLTLQNSNPYCKEPELVPNYLARSI